MSFAVLCCLFFFSQVPVSYGAPDCCVYLEQTGENIQCIDGSGALVQEVTIPADCPSGTLPENIRGAYYNAFGSVETCGNVSGMDVIEVNSSGHSFCQAGIAYQRNNPNDDSTTILKSVVTTFYSAVFDFVTGQSCCVPYDKSKTPTYSCAQSNVRSGGVQSVLNFFFSAGGSFALPESVGYYLYCGSEELPSQVPPLSPDNLRFQYEEDKYTLFPVSCNNTTPISGSVVPPYYQTIGTNVTVNAMCGSLGATPPTAPTSTSGGQQLTGDQLQAFLEGRYSVPPGYTGPLPDCAFTGTCSDVNDLLQLGINVGKWIFGFLGTAALVMFVYGGFVWVSSGGSPERVKQGKNIVVAAVVGLIIAFGAYILIDFLLDILSVQERFRAIQ